MRQISLGILAIVLMSGIALAQNDGQPRRTVVVDSKGKPVTDVRDDPHFLYYGNTYANYHPSMAEAHHWWNEDGTEQFFQANWLPEGLIYLKTSDGDHDSFVANNQWCSHNAKNSATAGNAVSRAIREVDNPRDKPPDPNELNNNKNGCQPVVDAQPGDHWFKLHLNGRMLDEREQYSLMPGHQ